MDLQGSKVRGDGARANRRWRNVIENQEKRVETSALARVA
jgi:hypothetical protein